MKNLLTFIFLLLFSLLYGQNAPNFIVTDTEGIEHRLYEDHLDQGQTVVIKLFFSTCPPCIALADDMEALYQEWGAGEGDVEFFEFSILTSDTDQRVRDYKNEHGITFKAAGFEGGGRAAAMPYQTGQYGTYTGTPTFIVIAPDGSLEMGFPFAQLNSEIEAAVGDGNNIPDPTTFSVNVQTQSSVLPTEVRYYLTSQDNPALQYEIGTSPNGQLSFEYPSEEFPEINNPEIRIEVDGPIIDNSVKPTDLLDFRKHLLELELFDQEYKEIAADLNGDGNLNPPDLLILRKALLELITEFPNNTPNWKAIPSVIPIEENSGQTIDLNVQLIKIGNVN